MKNLLSIPYRDSEIEKELKIPNFMLGFKGHFLIPVGKEKIQVIASNFAGWEHVSMSAFFRCPTFNEIVTIKEMFFETGEIAFQVYPKKSNYVNFNSYTLHLWRPTDTNVPIPNIKEVLEKHEFSYEKRIFKEGTINDNKYVIIYDPEWASWENLCQIKQLCFGDNEVLQYHVSKEIDLNEKKIIILWEHKNNFKLPPKELVF